MKRVGNHSCNGGGYLPLLGPVVIPSTKGEDEMRTAVSRMRDLFGRLQQWVVPVYQRRYEWKVNQPAKQIQRLWSDMEDKALERLEGRKEIPHYFGAILCEKADGGEQPYGQDMQRYFLVDGQQRVTSSQLALAALREVARKRGVRRIVAEMDDLLLNSRDEDGLARTRSDDEATYEEDDFKLRPSEHDRYLFRNIAVCSMGDLIESVWGGHFKAGTAKLRATGVPKMLKAYGSLYESIDGFVKEMSKEDYSEEEVMDALAKGILDGFQVVVISLGPDDDAQDIFESLNGLGEPLSPFDLVRNDVFLRARKKNESEKALFAKWRVFEEDFWVKGPNLGRKSKSRADQLLTHTVVAELGRQVNVDRISTEYRRYAVERGARSVSEELDMLISHSEVYRAIEECRREAHQGKAFIPFARLLHAWEFSMFVPVVLWLESRANRLDAEAPVSLYEFLESYIVRRTICGLESNYNKIVPPIVKAMEVALQEGDDVVEACAEHVMSLRGDTAKFPPNIEFAESFSTVRAYGRISAPRLRHILHKINEKWQRPASAGSIVLSDALTIEHIMPREWAQHWPLPNGEYAPCSSVGDPRAEMLPVDTRSMILKRERIVDTLGNLTLLTREDNSSAGNEPWIGAPPEHPGKRQILEDENMIALHSHAASLPQWSEETIVERAQKMSEVARDIWPFNPRRP